MTDTNPGGAAFHPGPGETDSCFGCMRQSCRRQNYRINALDRGPAGSLKTALVQGFITLLLPMVLFGTVFLVSGILFPRLKEPLRAFLGLIFLFAGALIIYRIRRRCSASH